MPELAPAGERMFRAELAELRTANDCVAEYLDLPKSTKSTISVAFSADHRRFASTHGDHTVKVVDFDSKEVVSTLVGHRGRLDREVSPDGP